MAFDHSTRRIYAIIGELVARASTMDDIMTEMVSTLFDLDDAVFSPFIVSMLDLSRKVELVKERAKLFGDAKLKKNVLKLMDDIETVNRARNKACHSSVVLEDDGSDYLTTIQGSKFFKAVRTERALNTEPSGPFSARVNEDELTSAIILSYKISEQREEIIEQFAERVRIVRRMRAKKKNPTP